MRRRKLLLLTGGVLTTATAGCLGSTPGSDSTPESPPQIEAEFTVKNSDLIVTHLEGDVLQSGQTVYMTVAGEKVSETTLDSNVHTGGEIIRLTDAEEDYHQARRIGLYLSQGQQSHELATKEVMFRHPSPSTQIAFDYNSNNGDLDVLHDGGASITTDNTGKLTVTGDLDNAPVELIVDGSNDAPYSSGDTLFSFNGGGSGTEALSSGEVVDVEWESNGGGESTTLGTFEAP